MARYSMPWYRRYMWSLIWRKWWRVAGFIALASVAISAYLLIAVSLDAHAAKKSAERNAGLHRAAYDALVADVQRLHVDGAITLTDIKEHTTPVEMNWKGKKI